MRAFESQDDELFFRKKLQKFLIPSGIKREFTVDIN